MRQRANSQPRNVCPSRALVIGHEANQFDQNRLSEVFGVGIMETLELRPAHQERRVQAREPGPGVRLIGPAQPIQESERGRGHGRLKITNTRCEWNDSFGFPRFGPGQPCSA